MRVVAYRVRLPGQMAFADVQMEKYRLSGADVQRAEAMPAVGYLYNERKIGCLRKKVLWLLC